MGWDTKVLALNSVLASLGREEVAGWEQGNWRKRPSSLWCWIKAALGAGLLVWGSRRGKGTQLRHRHFKNLLLFHLNSLPPACASQNGISALESKP